MNTRVSVRSGGFEEILDKMVQNEMKKKIDEENYFLRFYSL